MNFRRLLPEIRCLTTVCPVDAPDLIFIPSREASPHNLTVPAIRRPSLGAGQAARAISVVK
jgi:hypothetical protein